MHAFLLEPNNRDRREIRELVSAIMEMVFCPLPTFPRFSGGKTTDAPSLGHATFAQLQQGKPHMKFRHLAQWK